MKIVIKRTLILVILLSFYITGNGQPYDFVKVLEGSGIVFNNDTITFEGTSLQKACEILQVKHQPTNEILSVMWDGYDLETLESTSGSYWLKEVEYKSLLFEFTSESDKEDFNLTLIRIGGDKSIKAYTSKGLEMGEIDPDILNIYPVSDKESFISADRLVYNLFSYGVSFFLKENKFGKKQLIKIELYKK